MRVRYSNAEIAKCSCSKCHTVELNGCVGCHNNQRKGEELDDPASQSKEQQEMESTNLKNDPEIQQKQSNSVEEPNSEPTEPKKGPEEPEQALKKSKNQQGSD